MNIPAFLRLFYILKNHIYKVLNLKYYSIVDLQGRTGADGEKIYIDSYYAYGLYSTSQRGGWRLVYKSSQAKSGHNGVTIHSTTVPWDGTQAGLAAYQAKTGETDAAGSGCWVLETDNITVEMAGAVGDKTVDDSPAFAKATSVLSATGGGTVKFSGSYLIDTNLDVAELVNLKGPLEMPGELRYGVYKFNYDATGGTLVINSSATITTKDCASVTKCMAIRKGLDLPFASGAAATAGVAAFAGTAFTVGGTDAYFAHMLILGFNRAIDSNNFERPRCEYVYGDCTNGIRFQAVFDIAYVENCHMWPFTTTHQAWTTGAINSRTGTAFEYKNVGDWNKWTNCFSYGYANGFVIDSCNNVQLVSCGNDYDGASASTSVGVSVLGTSRHTSLIGHQTAAQGTGVLINSSSALVAATIESSSFWNNDSYHIRVQSGRAVISGGNKFYAGPVGVQIESASLGAIVDGNDFDTVTAPIAGSGTAYDFSDIGKNKFTGCTDSSVGIRRVFNNQFSQETFSTYSSSTSGNSRLHRLARGSVTAPTVSQNADIPFKIQGQVYTGTAFGDVALIRGQASGAPAAGSTPGAIILSTTPSGSTGLVDRVNLDDGGVLKPVTDNAYSLGKTGQRWSEVWAANGTIQTSDRRTKANIQDASLGLSFINSLRPVSYKWIEGGNNVIRQVYLDKDGNEIPEGEPIPEDATLGRIITESKQGYRTHWGLIAQEVKEAVDAAGVDFGGWVLTDKNDPESQQALRYDQFISPLIKAVQELSAEVEALKKRKTRNA